MESTRAMTRERGAHAESKNCEILLFPTADRRFETKVKCPTGRASFWVKFPTVQSLTRVKCPGFARGGMGGLELTGALKPSSSTPAITRVTFTPAHRPEISASSLATASGLELPIINSFSPWALPYSPPPVGPDSSVSVSTKATVTPVHIPGIGVLPSATESDSRPLVANDLPPWTPPCRAPSVKPSFNISPISSTHDEVLTMVASAMKDISMTQQKLVYNQSLPPIQFQRFSGTPAEFPLFKQRFKRIVMSREDMDDDSKMTRLLQFLDGKAKQAVSGLETVPGGVHQALQILENRYGRPCVIVGSVVTNLVKGPPIISSDKVALRKFADCATRALATLKSMNWLSQINQGNIVSMTERLPKPLQDKFAALAYDLETKGQHFPTLADFVGFVNKHASIANHPVSCKPQQSSYNNPLRNKRELPHGKSDLPKFTMSISNRSKPSVQSSRQPQKIAKGKSNNCRCCGQAQTLYRCEEFKRKMPRERMFLVSSKKLCPNCLKDTEHSTDTCPSSFRCQIEGCGAFHHSLLHQTQLHISVPETPGSVDSAAAVDTTTSAILCATTRTEDPGTILLQVVPLRVIGADGLAVTTYAMLDCGSEITLVDPSTCSFLKTQWPTRPFGPLNSEQSGASGRRKSRSCSGIHH